MLREHGQVLSPVLTIFIQQPSHWWTGFDRTHLIPQNSRYPEPAPSSTFEDQAQEYGSLRGIGIHRGCLLPTTGLAMGRTNEAMELCGRYRLPRGNSRAWSFVSALAVETERKCPYHPKSLHATVYMDSFGCPFLPWSTRLFRESPCSIFKLPLVSMR